MAFCSALDRLRRLPLVAITVLLTVPGPLARAATDVGQAFATPEAAVSALAAAVQAGDQAGLRAIFGPTGADLLSADPVQAANEYAAFAVALAEGRSLIRESETRCRLELGRDGYAFPVPIVLRAGCWGFDTAEGREELVNRRIGRNEVATLWTLRACVEAQREYARADRDGSEVLQYARKFLSSPGRKDGLFWSWDLDGERSPLGPLVALAHWEGYGEGVNPGTPPQPYHGYFYRILMRQGRHAPGGKYDYCINGHMIGGFAFIAWPARYGETGVMTFIVNQRGRVYEQDLGPKTAARAARLKAYDPDPAWRVSRD